MKWIVLAVALALPSTASAKVWVNKECTHVVISDGEKFFHEGPETALTTCKIHDWPISRETATLWCGVNGTKVNAEWPDDNTLLWNDMKLSLYTGPLPCPQEEPD
jgi:hypothetical protein